MAKKDRKWGYSFPLEKSFYLLCMKKMRVKCHQNGKISSSLFFSFFFLGGFTFLLKKKKEGTIKMITLYLDGRDGREKYHGMCLRFCHSIFMMMLNGMWSKLVDKRFCVQQHVSIIYHHTSPSRVRTSLFPPSRYIKSRDNDARQMVNSTQIYCSPRRPL